MTVVVQLSDSHIGGTWGVGDPVALLERAVAAVRELRPAPDAILFTGDLSDNGTAEEYAVVKELLAPLGVPVHPVPGNHDDRAAMRAAFGLPGEGADRVDHVAEAGELRLVCADSMIPGEDGGSLDSEWIAAALEDPRPTILAMHHPPLLTGVPVADDMGLPEAQRAALAGLLARHPQVRTVACGHLHWSMTGELGGRRVVVAPSTYVMGRLDFTPADREMTDEPRGFLVHVLRDGDLITYARAL